MIVVFVYCLCMIMSIIIIIFFLQMHDCFFLFFVFLPSIWREFGMPSYLHNS